MVDVCKEYNKTVLDVVSLLVDREADCALSKIKSFGNLLKRKKCTDYNPECMVLLGYANYLRDKKNYKSSLELVNEAGFLADYNKNISAKMLNEFVRAEMLFAEKDLNLALEHYKIAGEYMSESVYDLSEIVAVRMNQINKGLDFSHPVKADPLVSLVKIGRSITALTDIKVLLKVIAEETKVAIQADRCTVFLWDKETDELWSMVALGLDSEEIRFPASKGLAGYVAKSGESINIKDAYNDERFNPDVDLKTGYKTNTILCLPIKNNNQEIIGVFQVLNKLNGCFTQSDEDLLSAIGGSASIALENAQLFARQEQLYREQKELFESFIDTLATSIDARDKITAGHSLRVKLYSVLIAKTLKLSQKDIELIEKAAILHDIGKIGIMDSVLQKEGKLTNEEYAHIQEHARITHDILDKIHMSKDFKLITEIACSHHEKYNGMGYYRGLKGEEIPLGGRILAVADVFDAITSKRHYRDRMPILNVINILLKDSGTHFDKSIVDVFLGIPLLELIQVFLTENPTKILIAKDVKVLAENSLKDIYEAGSVEEKTKKQKKLLEVFESYYASKGKED